MSQGAKDFAFVFVVVLGGLLAIMFGLGVANHYAQAQKCDARP